MPVPFSPCITKLLHAVDPAFSQEGSKRLKEGLRALSLGLVEEALASALDELRIDSNNIFAIALSADSFFVMGRPFEAVDLLRRACFASPAKMLLSLLLVEALFVSGRCQEAEVQIFKVLVNASEFNYNDYNVLFLLQERLVWCLNTQQRFADAWDLLRYLQPFTGDQARLSAEIFLELALPFEAIPYARMFAIANPSASSIQLLARCYFFSGDQITYANVLERAILLKPFNGQAAALAIQARLDQSDDPAVRSKVLNLLSALIEDHGNCPELCFLMAKQLLLEGRFEQGWIAYESRLLLSESQLSVPCSTEYNNESFAGKSVVLVAEQGVGDILFFARFLPKILSEAHLVLLLVEPRLGPLLRRSYPQLIVLHQVDLATAMAGTSAIWVPLASLPIRYGFNTSLISDSYSSNQICLHPGLRSYWAQRLAEKPETMLKIGISLTAGGDSQVYSHRKRDVDPALVFPPLLGCESCLIDLQHRDVISVEHVDGLSGLHRFEGITRDIDHLFALISQLDLLVTSDQTNAFVGGILGIPTIAIIPPNPNFMFMLEVGKTPWYPSLNIVRAERWGDWWSAESSYRNTLKVLLTGMDIS